MGNTTKDVKTINNKVHWPPIQLLEEKFYAIDWTTRLADENEEIVPGSCTWDDFPIGITNLSYTLVDDVVSRVKIKGDALGTYMVTCNISTQEIGAPTNTQKLKQHMYITVK